MALGEIIIAGFVAGFGYGIYRVAFKRGQRLGCEVGGGTWKNGKCKL